MAIRAALLGSLPLCALSCGGGRGAQSPESKPQHDGALHWYPLDPGMQWVYMVGDSSLDQRMMSITKVISSDTGAAVILTGTEKATFRVLPDGIVREPAGGYLLKTPPKLGEKWPAAEGANVEVVQVDAHVVVEAGAFDGCAVTRERFPDGETIERTFCPEVGPVIIEAKGLTEQGTMAVTTAKLRSFGLPETLPAKGTVEKPR
jgi:hypothetical protein